jgi:hypothetical protein
MEQHMFAFFKSDKSIKKTNRNVRRCRLAVEELTARVAPSASPVSLDMHGDLHIRGTAHADQVTVSVDPTDPSKISVVDNGKTFNFDQAGVDKITFNGGKGNDSFTNTTNINALALGGPGRDTLIGGPANDILEGGPGADTLIAGVGNTILQGGPGNDILHGGLGNNVLDGGKGINTISGDGGLNQISHGQTLNADTRLEASLTGSGGATGEAQFNSSLNSFELEVEGAPVSASLDVVIDGTKVGTLSTDDSGEGKFELVNVSFTVQATSTITVGDTANGGLSGTFQTATESGLPLHANLTGDSGAQGCAQFNGDNQTLHVQVEFATPNTSYDVSIDGTKVGQINTDADGLGALETTVGNLTVSAGSKLVIGDAASPLLTGTFVAPGDDGGGRGSTGDTVYDGQLSNSAGATGSAEFDATTGTLSVAIAGAAASTSLDVSIDGTSVGSIATDANGAGQLSVPSFSAVAIKDGSAITVGDPNGDALSGTFHLAQNTPPTMTATHFLVLTGFGLGGGWTAAGLDDGSSQAYVGVPTSVVVIALDDANDIVPSYTGTIQLSSTDAKTTLADGTALPTTYTFTADDHGIHRFSLLPGATGTETITADDSANSVKGTLSLSVAPAPTATHFMVTSIFDWGPMPVAGWGGDDGNGSGNAQVGLPSFIEVVALDDANQVVPNYTGTIQLSSTDTATTLADGTALPATYTFTGDDHGFHTFSILPGAAGTETITAQDTTNTAVQGTLSLDVATAPVAAKFLITPGFTFGSDGAIDPNTGYGWSGGNGNQAYVGVATTINVIALDDANHLVPNYTGTIQLSSNDTKTTLADGTALPATYTFTADDHGVHQFSILPGAAGTETITAQDTVNTTVQGTLSLNVTAAPVASQIEIDVWDNAITGVPTGVLVRVLDSSNNVVPNYTGTVQLSTSDTAAKLFDGSALPATYTFGANDAGRHLFLVNFATTGSQTVTVADAANSLSKTVTVNVMSLPDWGGGGGPPTGWN